MKKFAVFSGFLGSGKTTTMIALTRCRTDHSGKTAIISNDLGGKGLADHQFARLAGCNASEITGECICFCHDVLMERLNECFDGGCELVISDIPGFGVGALEHVYHGLTDKYPGQLALAPFTVVTEPRTVEYLRSGRSGDMGDIQHAQLMEADLIVLNKCDLLSSEQIAAEKTWLSVRYPQAQVITISARHGTGLEELSRALTEGEASLRHPDIEYSSDRLQNAMKSLSEYYIQYYASVCCNSFDGNRYLTEMAERVQAAVLDTASEIPHLKLLGWKSEGDYGKVDLLGTDRPVEIVHRFQKPCTELAVALNGSAACPEKQLSRIITNTVKTVSEEFQLDLLIYHEECFSMGEEE